MHDFGKLVYLDVPKTGSTFISEFLNATCRLPLVKRLKHHGIGYDFRPDSFYFISVRNPFHQYMSLYRYGLDGKGMVRRQLVKNGHAHLYRTDDEGTFNDWMRFILAYENAPFLGEGYGQFGDKLDIGFLSYRFLKLSLVYPLENLQTLNSYDELVLYYEKANIAKVALWQERLNQALLQLATDLKPEYFHQEKVHRFLEESGRLNVSLTQKDVRYQFENDVWELVNSREKFLLTTIYKEVLSGSA